MSKELKELVKILLKVSLLVIYILQMVESKSHIEVYNYISYLQTLLDHQVVDI